MNASAQHFSIGTGLAALALSLAFALPASVRAGDVTTAPASPAASDAKALPAAASPLLSLGPGDAVSIQVYGRPELTTTTYIADDGTVPVPLAGRVPVAKLSPADAGARIAKAFKDGKYLVDPQVTVYLVQQRSQQVSVLGAVRTPGRYVIDSSSTVMDVLAQAGGILDTGSDVVTLIRGDEKGGITKTPVSLKGLNRDAVPLTSVALKPGDSIFVPAADQFYVYGEVHAPNMYRLEPGMTVEQAISRSGGITPRGSRRRIEIRRKESDGHYVTQRVDLAEAVRADDVIRVKERIF